MAPDVLMLWFSLDDARLHVPRVQLREWALEFGLDLSMVRNTEDGAFARACRDTTVEYRSEGVPRTLSARPGTSRNDDPRFDVFTDTGRRVAQVRYVQPRVNALRVLGAHHSFQHTISTRATPGEAEAARAWLSEAEKRFGDLQGLVKPHTMRRVIRCQLESIAVPVRARANHFLFYIADLEAVARVGAFVERVDPSAASAIVGVDPGSVSALLPSVEEFLGEQVDSLIAGIELWAINGHKRTRDTRALRAARWRASLIDLRRDLLHHEKHLGVSLLATRARLALAEEMIAVFNGP